MAGAAGGPDAPGRPAGEGSAADRGAGEPDAAGALTAFDGVPVDVLAQRCGAAAVHAHAVVGSTMDVAHALAAAGAPAGTLVLADAQASGRGRAGRSWHSAPGAGLWLTLLERPRDAEALAVLSLRLGLAAAEALDPFAGERVGLKWPNDLHLAAGKLAGVLVEARWREGAPDWVAIGLGVNVRAGAAPDGAAALYPGVARTAVLAALVPALRAATARRGALSADELAAWGARDLALGRVVAEPERGTVDGLDPDGALRIRRPDGSTVRVRHGSLRFADDR